MNRRSLHAIFVLATAAAQQACSESKADPKPAANPQVTADHQTQNSGTNEHATPAPIAPGPETEAGPKALTPATTTGEPMAVPIGATKNPPTYKGFNPNSQKCDAEYSLYVETPTVARDTYPLFLYFTGTKSNSDSSRYDDDTAKTILKAMADGEKDDPYYAISVNYFNSNTSYVPQNIACTYGRGVVGGLTNPNENLFMTVCNLPNVDCSKIVVWGFSQGAGIAIWAHDYNTRTPPAEEDKAPPHYVKAAWLTGYATLPVNNLRWTIPTDRMRIVNGSKDDLSSQTGCYYRNDNPDLLNQITNLNCIDTNNCLNNPEGGGWYLVKPQELNNYPDHCWFDRVQNCTNPNLDAKWLDRDHTNQFFSLPATVAWLKKRARS